MQVRSLGQDNPLDCQHSNPLQCSCLENPMNRGIWWAVVHRVSELDMTEATECKQFYIIAAVNLAPVTSTNAVCHQERFCQRSSTWRSCIVLSAHVFSAWDGSQNSSKVKACFKTLVRPFWLFPSSPAFGNVFPFLTLHINLISLKRLKLSRCKVCFSWFTCLCSYLSSGHFSWTMILTKVFY